MVGCIWSSRPLLRLEPPNKMPEQQRIIILGGGTAGWMTAAALARFLPVQRYQITLIESEQLGTVGVGEATIPLIRQFNQWIGLDETEFLQATGATFKLAIRFQGWGTPLSDYFHPFGYSGDDLNGLPFHQIWCWLAKKGLPVKAFDQYSLAVLMAQQGRFQRPVPNSITPLSAFNYAYHLDANRYAALLRKHATARGVKRIEGQVVQVLQQPNGDLQSLILAQGTRHSADLFIDCSGFAAVLIEQTLKTGFDNWQHWLPCDRALAVPSEADPHPAPYTSSKAVNAGWQWRIPLQHRTGNGLVYSSAFLDDTQATKTLLDGLLQPASASPRVLHFTTGRRRRSWQRNCIAIGLAAGFLEPLESTSLHLIQLALEKLLLHFPSGGTLASSEIERDSFNQQMELEYLRVRDFLILHYKINQRPEPFWQQCANMNIPDSLQQRMSMFQENGHLLAYRQGLFQPPSWLAVMLGQGLKPLYCDLRLQPQNPDFYQQSLTHYQHHLQQLVTAMPSHQRALQALSGHESTGQTTENAASHTIDARSIYGTRRPACNR